MEYNEDEQNIPEDPEIDQAEYERRKARLAKTMTFMIIMILLLFGLLVYLNNYYNG